MTRRLDYQDALALLRAHNQNESLVKHGMAVSAAMGAYARKYGEDELTWRVTGLLHDVDYEKHPTIEEHGKVGAEWLKDGDYPDHVVHAVIAHNDYHGVPRDDLMSRALFACDELTGLITATALVRPTKSIHGLEVSSVRKKMKDKAFARAVSREMMLAGADDLGVPFDELVSEVVTALSGIADRLGLAGVPA